MAQKTENTPSVEIREKALANVKRYAGYTSREARENAIRADGFVPAEDFPLTLNSQQVQQGGVLAVIYCRAGWRVGVVEKVGKKNLTVVLTTDGAIREADEHYAQNQAVNVERVVQGYADQAKKDYAYWRSVVDGTHSYPSWMSEDSRAETLGAARAALVLYPTEATFVSEKADRARQDILARKSMTRLDCVNFTRKSSPISESWVKIF